jgi:hypothetical protein
VKRQAHKSRRADEHKTNGGELVKNAATLIGSLAALIAAVSGFIQATHIGGLAFAYESGESPSPSPGTPSPAPSFSPSGSPGPSASASPTKSTFPTSSPQPRLCLPTTMGTTIVTVMSFEPTWNDFRIDLGIPFSGSKIRLSQDVRTVRVGVKIDNHGPTVLGLGAQNWRLFDGTSYAFASPAPSPSPAYVSTTIAPGRSYSGFVTFSAVPRSVTALSFEAKFNAQSAVYKLPTTETKC